MCRATSSHCAGHEPSTDLLQEHSRGEELQWGEIGPVIGCGLLLLVGYVAGWLGYPSEWLFCGSAVIGAWPTAISTYHSLRQKKLNVDLLMLTGALGAAVVGHIDEAAVLMLLFSLAELLEAFAMGRTRRALKSLLSLRPDEATVERNGQPQRVPLDSVAVGETVLVGPGERIPLDGIISSGEADIDESALTGESLPRFKGPEAAVLAGSINLSGALRIQTSRVAGESTLARIVQLVEQARGSQAQTQRLLNRYVVFYVVVVLSGAALMAIVPPLFSSVPWSAALYRAMTLLVVASPCALVISTPATILSAIAAAARRGILFKGGAAVESLGQANAVAFDKTGTLTDGKLKVSHIVSCNGQTEDEILALTAAAEAASEHPLAKAIVREAQQRELEIPTAEAFRTTAGLGVTATIGGRQVVVGSRRFLQTQGIETTAKSLVRVGQPASAASDEGDPRGKTIWAAENGELLGYLVLSDQLRAESASAVAELRKLGIRKVIMLTGDESHAAEAMAAGSGIDSFAAGLLPEEKVERLKSLSAGGWRVVMVGDGINDAPALATAEVGVAMGAAGTDLAIESADVVLMSSHLGQLVEAVSISRQARKILTQNLLFASAVILGLVGVTLLGNMAISVGVVGHEGSTLVVVLNGLRLLVTPRHKAVSG